MSYSIIFEKTLSFSDFISFQQKLQDKKSQNISKHIRRIIKKNIDFLGISEKYFYLCKESEKFSKKLQNYSEFLKNLEMYIKILKSYMKNILRKILRVHKCKYILLLPRLILHLRYFLSTLPKTSNISFFFSMILSNITKYSLALILPLLFSFAFLLPIFSKFP